MKRELIAITIIVVMAGMFSGALRDGIAVTTDLITVNDGDVRYMCQSSLTYEVVTDEMFWAPSHRHYLPDEGVASFARRGIVKFDLSGLSIPDVGQARLMFWDGGVSGGSPYCIVEWVDARNTSTIVGADYNATLLGTVGVINAGREETAATSNADSWETIVIDPDFGPAPFLKTPHNEWGEVLDQGNDISRAVFTFAAPDIIPSDFRKGVQVFVKSAELIIPLDSSSTSDPMKPLPGVHAYAVDLTDTAGGQISADDWGTTETADLGMLVPAGNQPGGGTEYSLDVTESLTEFVENPTLGSYYPVRLKMEGENGDSQDTTVDWAYAFDGSNARIEYVLQGTIVTGGRVWSIDVTEELQAAINASDTYFSLRLRLASDPYVEFGVTTNYNWYLRTIEYGTTEQHPRIRYGDAYVPAPVASTAANASILQWESEYAARYQIYCKDSLDDAVPWKKTGPEYVGTGGVMSGLDQGDVGVTNPSDPSVTERYYSIVKSRL